MYSVPNRRKGILSVRKKESCLTAAKGGIAVSKGEKKEKRE